VLRRLALGLLVFSVGCAGLPHPTELDVARARTRWPDATVGSLEAARGVYVQRCSACHPLHHPQDYTASEWDVELAKMGPRAHLTPEEQDEIRSYLSNVRGEKPPAITGGR